MSVVISDKVSSVSFVYSDGREILLDKDLISMKKGGILSGILKEYVYITAGEGFTKSADNEVVKLHYSDVSSPVLASNDALINLILGYKVSSGAIMGSVQITDGSRSVTLEPNSSLPVTLQDQHTPVIIAKFSNLEQSTTTTVTQALGDYTITVASPTGIAAGKMITIFNPTSIRFSIFTCVSILGSVVTLDSPLDFAYPSGSYVDVSEMNMAVNGSVTPVVFGVRNNAGAIPPPGVVLSMDVTRVIFTMFTATAPQFNEFGDLARLTNGLLCRKRDGEYHNIFNIKDNGDMTSIMYDIQYITATAGGQDGLYGRLSWAGQEKMGVTVRLAINEDIEIIVQDNLTGLGYLSVTAEGSIVTP
jgi:hypothetical protein